MFAMCGPISFAPGTLNGGLVLAALIVLRLAVVIGTLRLMSALGSTWLVLVIMAFLMVIPFINLVALIMEDRRATGVLRRAGIPIGLMGVSDEDVVRCLAMNVCRQCGYDLTGNESGQCSECGVAIPNARVVVGHGGE